MSDEPIWSMWRPPCSPGYEAGELSPGRRARRVDCPRRGLGTAINALVTPRTGRRGGGGSRRGAGRGARRGRSRGCGTGQGPDRHRGPARRRWARRCSPTASDGGRRGGRPDPPPGGICCQDGHARVRWRHHDSPAFGPPRSPWSPDRTRAVSGARRALAAGYGTPLALGTTRPLDRIPRAFCGVVGSTPRAVRRGWPARPVAGPTWADGQDACGPAACCGRARAEVPAVTRAARTRVGLLTRPAGSGATPPPCGPAGGGRPLARPVRRGRARGHRSRPRTRSAATVWRGLSTHRRSTVAPRSVSTAADVRARLELPPRPTGRHVAGRRGAPRARRPGRWLTPTWISCSPVTAVGRARGRGDPAYREQAMTYTAPRAWPGCALALRPGSTRWLPVGVQLTGRSLAGKTPARAGHAKPSLTWPTRTTGPTRPTPTPTPTPTQERVIAVHRRYATSR